MSELEYHEIPDFDLNAINQMLQSGNHAEICEALISIAFYSGDYELSVQKACEFSTHQNIMVRACALECFGHIARLHKKLDLNCAIPIIKKGLEDKNEFVRDKADNTIDDIVHFMKINRKNFE